MNDDAHYDEVAKEIEAQAMVPGLWAKAFAEAGGQIDKARAFYIKLRVSQLAEAASDKSRKERRVAIQATKHRIASRFKRIACTFLSIIFGVLSGTCFVGGIMMVINAIKGADMKLMIGTAVFLFVIALVFGLIAFKCIKAAQKKTQIPSDTR